jgi:TorA maturation chaperone TorD
MSEVTDLQGLAVLYRLLSLGFSAPDEHTLEQLRRLTVFGARHAPEEGLAEILGELELALDDDDLLPELRDAYEALFGGGVRVSPYEASYEADPFRSGRQMADLAGFYRAFGAESTGPAAERPDHVGCELEFVSFLLLKRDEAGGQGEDEHAAVCREAEESFLRDHLGRWLPTFCREVIEVTESPVYRLLALSGERLTNFELARRGIEVVPVRAARRRTGVVAELEADELTCGGGTLAAEAAQPPRPAPA